MAVIVRHKETGERFVLVGTGLGTAATARSSLLFGDLLPAEEETTTAAAAVCDSEGRIRWVRSESLMVVSIDALPPTELLAET
jgi:hypothetical protein